MNFRALGLLIAIATLAAGCNERSLRPLTPCTISGVSNKLGSDVNDVDMLFMIDTSNSMVSEQALLATALAPMVTALIAGEVGTCPDPDPDVCRTFRPVKSLRVGVITPDIGVFEGDGMPGGCTIFGNDGRLFDDQRNGGASPDVDPTPVTGACPTGADPWLQFDEGDDQGTFETAFECLANVGTGGCGFEQQLEAVLKSLVGGRAEADALSFADFDGSGAAGHMATDGYNEGFIRENSLLAVIVVTDEDDCSGTSNALYDTSNIGAELTATWNDWSTLRWGPSGVPADDTDPTVGEVNSVAQAAAMMTEIDSALGCHLKTQFLQDVQRYIQGISNIRTTDQSDLTVFSVIAGIDQTVVDSARTASEDDNGNPTIDRFGLMLGDSSMDETIDYDYRDRINFADLAISQAAGRVTPACRRFEAGSGTAFAQACTSNWDCARAADGMMLSRPHTYECNDAGDTCDIPNLAAPARRLIEVAEGIEELGGSSVVESICQDNFDGALEAIIARIASVLNRACLPSALNPTADGTVGCDVVEFLPLTGAITTCEEAAAYGGRDPVTVRIEEDGREVCRINQIPIDRANPTVPLESDPAGPGWYYDDFTTAADIGAGDGMVETPVDETCTNFDTAQRIAFTFDLGKPIAGASIKLECLQPSVGGDVDNAEVATPCTWTAADLDAMTPVCTSVIPGETMICDSLSNTCQFSCTSDAECPGGFVCYARPEPAPDGRTACADDAACTGDAAMVAIGAVICGATGVCVTDPEDASTRAFCANPTCDSTGISD